MLFLEEVAFDVFPLHQEYSDQSFFRVWGYVILHLHAVSFNIIHFLATPQLLPTLPSVSDISWLLFTKVGTECLPKLEILDKSFFLSNDYFRFFRRKFVYHTDTDWKCQALLVIHFNVKTKVLKDKIVIYKSCQMPLKRWQH